MKNPWLDISLNDYEGHMAYGSVLQLQALNGLMKKQLRMTPSKKVMILGVAGGNGLEWVDTETTDTVYGIDVNPDYLSSCILRYPELIAQMEKIGYELIGRQTFHQENGKVLTRLDLSQR